MSQNDSKYLPELMAEKDAIDPSFEHAVRLISQEIERIKNPPKPSSPEKPRAEKVLLDVVSGRPSKLECDVLIPVERHPNVNFVGRLIGPRGATMKGMQEITNTRMAVLGKGSVREKDRKKVEEGKDAADKYAHLNYPLHVHISAVGPVPQAYVNLGRAVAEIQKLILIDDDQESQFQASQGMGGMRGGGGGGMSSPGMRGGRGTSARGFQRGGRGGMQRGSASVSRGSSGISRGTPRGTSRGRGAGRGQAQQYAQMQQSAESYADDFSFDSYGGATGASGFDQAGYEGYDESYNANYDASYAAATEGYGDGSYAEDYGYGQESYDSYGNGTSAASSGGGFSAPGSFRGKMRGGSVRGRQKPY